MKTTKSSEKKTKHKPAPKPCPPAAVARERAKVKALRAELRVVKNAHSDLLTLFKLATGVA